MPTVSVITPLYNGASHIEACIHSVAQQDFSNLEHIVIDNNSTDDGPDRVRELQKIHPHLTLISETIKGPGPARNAGILVAEGKYIAFLDADDAWKPEKLRKQIGAMEDAKAVFSWTAYDVIKDGEFNRVQQADTSITYEDLLSKRSVIGCLTAVYDAEILGKFFMNDLSMRQDFCLWLDILKAAEAENLNCIGVNESLATYNIHSDGLTADKKKAARMQWVAYRQHVGLSPAGAAKYFFLYAVRAVAVRMRKKFGT